MKVRIENNMLTKGHLLWKIQWYSICSIHRMHNPECNICATGNWRNVWITWFSGKVYDNFPNFWIWWMNFPKRKLKCISFIKIKRKDEII